MSTAVPTELARPEPRPKPLTRAELAAKKLRKIEDKILRECYRTVEAGLAGSDVDDGQTVIPEGWAEKYGAAQAAKRLRVATDIRKPSGERPGYFDLALRASRAITQARAAASEGQAPAPLNVAIVFNQFERREYPVIDVDVVEEPK